LASELVDVGDLSELHGQVGCHGLLLTDENLDDGDHVQEALSFLRGRRQLGLREPGNQVVWDQAG
jgi:hypothetical protein